MAEYHMPGKWPVKLCVSVCRDIVKCPVVACFQDNSNFLKITKVTLDDLVII